MRPATALSGTAGSRHANLPPGLRPVLVAAPRALGAATYWRRRLVVIVVLVALAFALTVAAGRIGAAAQLEDPVAGHVVVAPGQTLWDVAATTAPHGMDPRAHLAAIRSLNGLSGGDVGAWTVVLLPTY